VSGEDTSPAQRAGTLLRRIHSSYDKRGALPGGAAREKLDEYLCGCLGELASLAQEASAEPPPLEDAPPRPVALAMAQALLAHAHLSIFFHSPDLEATEPLPGVRPGAPDYPVVLESANLRRALGLQEWELDDLREEVDRRVGLALKQQRAVDWLWSHFGLPDAPPDALFGALFPGGGRGHGALGVVRHGAQLYVVIEQAPAPPPTALYLPFGPKAEAGGEASLGGFSGRYVDPSLRAALGRGVGASDEEVCQLFDRMVAVVPRAQLDAFLRHDHWRVRGLAGITGLGGASADAAAVVRSLAPESLTTEGFLRAEGGAVRVIDAKAAFDALALQRVGAVLRLIHAELLAGVTGLGGTSEAEGGFQPSVAALDLYDVPGQFRRALTPLLDWAEAPETSAWIATRLGVDQAAAKLALSEVHAIWREQIDRAWCGAPAPGQPRSVADVALFHLVGVHRALFALRGRPADSRWDHRDLALLFTGSLLVDQPVQALWSRGLDRAGAPVEEPVGRYFWPLWQRVLGSLDRDAETFSGPFTIDY
jgi:hypothetical protein